MAKGKTKKIYKEGDVVTVRLSPDSGANQEVLEWINKVARESNRSKEIIEAIKLKIIFDKKFGGSVNTNTLNTLMYGLINDAIEETSIAINNKQTFKKVDVNERKKEKQEKQEIYAEKEEFQKEINCDDSEHELYEGTNRSTNTYRNDMPGVRALKTLRKR